MRIKQFNRVLLTALLSVVSLSAMAEAGPICAGLLGGVAKDYAYLKWETDNDGNVNITIYPYDKTAETDPAKLTGWRNRGMADDLTAAKGWEMTIDGNDAVLADYFEKNYTPNPTQAAHSTVYQLKIKDGMKALLDGHTVVIKKTKTGSSICWYTPGNNNCYSTYAFEYLYGSSCAGMEAPANVAVNNGILTFDAVTGATTYKAYYYLGERALMSEVIANGTTLVRPMKLGGTYKVAVSAIDANGTESDLSDKVDWVLEDQSESSVGSSEYCSYAIGSGTSAAAMTWETDADGNVVLSISGDGATWRGTAFVSPANFTVGRVPGNAIFEQVYTEGAVTYTLRLKTGAQVALGETITYRGSLQWKTAADNNPYKQNQVIPYTYGSVCETAVKPVIDNIAADKTISVTAEGAENLDVNIYLAGDLFAKESVPVGGKLTFKPYLSGKTYQVTVVAKAEGQSDSEESDPYDWTPVPETYVPTASEVCSRQLTSQDGEAANTRVYMTFATVDEKIVVTLENATTNTGVSWRDKLTLAGFSMNNGVALSTFFEESVSGNTYTLALKDGKEIPHGTVIRYSGNIPWHTTEHNNCYLLAQTINYTYGSTNCATDEAPVLTASGEVMSGTSVRLTMRATDDFASTITYTISYDGAEDVVLSGANGATKTQDIEGLTQGTEYTFTIVASDGMHADTKQVILTPSSDLLPPSNVQATIVPTGRFSARLSLYADDNVAGNITYTITGAGISDPVVAPKGTATSVDISELTENTNYSYSVVARDEAGNEAEAVVTSMTTYSSSDNLAAAKPATANAEEGAHTGDKAVDAYETTYWGNYNKVNGKGDSWLSIDLCRTANVEAINILWQHYPDYAGIGIQSSTNGTDWTEIYTYTGTKFANNGRQVIYFEAPVEARYLRVKNEGATQSWYMSIYNFEVFGTATGAVTLDENENNVAIIRGLDGEVADVALNRSFIADGYWYTLCLPFDLTDEQLTEAFGAGYELAKLEDSYMKTEDVLFLDFRPKKMLEAGVPYLFMPGNNVEAPIVFSNVTVSNVSTINATSVASMTGFYQPTVVDESNYFLGTNNLLKKNNNTSATKAFRAFFTLDETVPSNVQARVRVVQQEDIVTDVENLSSEDSPQKVFMNGQFFILRNGIIYNAQGQRIK